MTAHPWALLLLLLVAQGALAQEDDAAAEDGAAKAECEECEEAWPYVEFLKIEMNEKVTEMLQDFKTSGGAEETVSQTMEKVMEVREAILKRIKAIRKKDEAVVICPDQRTIKQEEKLSEFRMEVMTILLSLVESDAAEKLKDIGDKLLKFRTTISNEVMRVLMLPQPTCGGGKIIIPPGDCSECKILSDLAFTLENLQECAKKKDDEEADAGADDAAGDAAAGDDDAADATVVLGAECPEPVMYSMTLIVQNEELDDAIAGLYTSIIEEVNDDAKRTEYHEMLTMLKDYREKIDENIGALLDIGDNEEKIKKHIGRNLRVLIGEVKTKLDQCNAGCGGGDCKSCAKPILDEVIDKMVEYKERLTADGEDDDEKKDYIRGDMITLINKNNDDSRAIVTMKIDEGDLDQCKKDELEVFNRIKGPMWMLVNLTIFGDVTMVEAMLTTSEDLLKGILSEYCTELDKPEPKPRDEDDNCEWEEYEKTKEYLVEVDNTIQNGLFKSNDAAAKMTALLGFVKIQEMFDKRVKKLFEDEATCKQELDKLKDKDNGYMTLLNKCMIQFMNPKVNFSDLNRLQRISCIKKLRNEMEDRTAELLQFELTKSLEGITDDGTATSR